MFFYNLERFEVGAWPAPVCGRGQAAHRASQLGPDQPSSLGLISYTLFLITAAML